MIKEEYSVLAPRGQFLHDPVVLALAWKKAHAYVRRHNWYADALELDSSAFDLEGKVLAWSAELESGEFKPRPSRLVPAPKNASWVFRDDMPCGWGPIDDNDATKRLELRPLAHLGIREQTAAAALMLCLAECVESAQGDPSIDAGAALAQGVYSYGNRLFCRWAKDRKTATFSWGSADTYSRYFQDYQQFVRRPATTAQTVDRETPADGRQTYIVKMDLAAFFDNVDIGKLVEILRAEYQRFAADRPERPRDDAEFWVTARRILDFTWSEKDAELTTLLKGSKLPDGLPQGMMASGFLANAYLLPFDRAVGLACAAKEQAKVGNVTITFHDYCRYVDDLRFVVSLSEGESWSEQEIQKELTNWVQDALDKSLGWGLGHEGVQLTLNGDKTELERVTHVAGAVGVGTRMKRLQRQLSGPFDLSTLEQVETGLSGLLSMAEAAAGAGAQVHGSNVPSLAYVAKSTLEVRDDTLTRFSAYRLCKSLRQRRMMLDLSEVREGQTAEATLRQEYEATARRLVSAWALNPSLVQVLRYAFDLYPSAELLEDVLKALNAKLDDHVAFPDQARVAWYVLAELFRAAAGETGRVGARDPGFTPADADQYRETLAVYSIGLLHAGGVPWYVQQQAALFLASVERPSDQLETISELVLYRELHRYLAGQSDTSEVGTSDKLSAAVMGYQVTGDGDSFAQWFECFAATHRNPTVRRALELIYLGCPVLFRLLTATTSLRSRIGGGLLSRELRLEVEARDDHEKPLPQASWIQLSVAINHPSRPFQQENALLHLARCLAELMVAAPGSAGFISPYSLAVRCMNWGALNDPRQFPLSLKVAGKQIPDSLLFKPPSWCKPEMAWRYRVGAVLRAAAVGQSDFTFSAQQQPWDHGWYRGLGSTALKRRIGMLHTSESLGGTISAITPWFSGLLGALLRWPGTAPEQSPHEAEVMTTTVGFKAVVELRVARQAELYGKSSASSIYRYPIRWKVRDGRLLRVALVQGLLPQSLHFSSPGLPAMNASPYRELHRNHTATLLHLAAKKIGAHASAHGRPHKPEVDLVVLPEYAVHVDDQDLLRAFSDDTGAMLHYGLLGMIDPVTSAPTNAARWLIPVRTRERRSWIAVDQGKRWLTDEELKLGVAAWCPHRVVVELCFDDEPGFRMAGAICYDATDLALVSDLRNETHMFVVPAMNKDVKTFDSMVSALRYHMYQHVLISNAGEFGGSTAQAPYDAEHKRVISHAHGGSQIAVSLFEVPLDHFGPLLLAKGATPSIGKTPPAGLNRKS